MTYLLFSRFVASLFTVSVFSPSIYLNLSSSLSLTLSVACTEIIVIYIPIMFLIFIALFYFHCSSLVSTIFSFSRFLSLPILRTCWFVATSGNVTPPCITLVASSSHFALYPSPRFLCVFRNHIHSFPHFLVSSFLLHFTYFHLRSISLWEVTEGGEREFTFDIWRLT